MRHEVTAAHTHSLFCSLQLFLLPLVSDNCHSCRSQELLRRRPTTGIARPVPSPSPPEFLHPSARPAGVETRSASVAAARKPQFLSRALCAPLFRDTARQLPHTEWSPRASPCPPPPSVPRVRTARFACRVTSSPFAPPQDRAASPQPLENWASPQGPYSELLAEIVRCSLPTWSLSPGLDSPCSFQGLVVALGFC